MNLYAHSMAALQNTQHILAQFEADGVTDIRFVRQQLHDHIAAVLVNKEKDHRQVVPRKKRIEQRSARSQKPMIPCSVCGAPAMIEPVNISPATMVGEGLRMAIVCLNPACRHTEYSSRSALEIIGGRR